MDAIKYDMIRNDTIQGNVKQYTAIQCTQKNIYHEEIKRSTIH